MISDPPDSPAIPIVSNIDSTKMTVQWTLPKSDGGSPILGYTVECKETTSSQWRNVNSDPVKETSFVVADLMVNSKYQFRVCAENKAGVGPPSKVSDIYQAKPPYGNYYPSVLYKLNNTCIISSQSGNL